jgi:insertion element IS1 protein InsB
LYEKLKYCKKATFYTDHWNAFAKVLPKQRHVIGKEHTTAIEQDNSNTRHHLARMTRRTKIVSQCVEMVDLSMKLWVNLSQAQTFKHYQQIFLTTFN